MKQGTGNYWGPSACISMKQGNYLSYILHLFKNFRKTGIQSGSASAIYTLQESI